MGVKEQFNSILPSLMEGNVNNSLQLSVLIEMLISKNIFTKDELLAKVEEKTKFFNEKAKEFQSRTQIIKPGVI